MRWKYFNDPQALKQEEDGLVARKEELMAAARANPAQVYDGISDDGTADEMMADPAGPEPVYQASLAPNISSMQNLLSAAASVLPDDDDGDAEAVPAPAPPAAPAPAKASEPVGSKSAEAAWKAQSFEFGSIPEDEPPPQFCR